MPLDNADWQGTNADKSRSGEYCFYCLKDGRYTVDYSMEQMIITWVKYSEEFNRYSNTQLSKEEIASLLKGRLPHLKRWKQKNETTEVYQKSINMVMEYIDRHLFEVLDLKTLSDVACLSEYHFHRIFRALIGENIGAYIQRLRLEFVAYKLLSTRLPLTRIVGLTSYRNIYTLSKAFRKHFGMPPSQYRKQSQVIYFPQQPAGNTANLSLTPRISVIADFRIVYINIRSAYQDPVLYKNLWKELVDFADDNRLNEPDSNFLSISLDDPVITPLKKCRFYIGITTGKPVKSRGKFGVMDIAGGEFAVFRYKGEYSGLHLLYRDIYLKWLPQSGYLPGNTFSFEIYLNTPGQVNSDELLTDVYIPVENHEV